MKKILITLMLIITYSVSAQDTIKPKAKFFKSFYENFLKYATVYGAGDYRSAYESSDKKYLIRQLLNQMKKD